MPTYNPKKVQVIVGSHIVTGYADGTFLNVERNADQFQAIVGADGESARVASADKSGLITLTLMQTSESNDFLSEALAADEATNVGTFTVMVRDLQGTTLVQSAEAWVKKYASVEFGKDSASREWVIETGELLMDVGGSIL